MSDRLDPELERAAGAVADHTVLDWESETAEHAELRRTLTGLQAIERLAAAHREARQMHESGAGMAVAWSEPAPTGGAPDPALQTPVFTWGFLRALAPIGQGGFGEVWRAWDPTLEREVALKLRRLAPAPAGGAPLARTSDPATRLWLEEARRLASVRHPNVLSVYGAAEHDGRAGLWTELVLGETLEHRLQREGPLEPREVARIGRDLCRALAAVHVAGLVHGDVKTTNVMLEPRAAAERAARPRVVLMDFGTAHQASRAGSREFAGSGTPLVMAPEVLAGRPPTPAADVYAVGVLLQRLVTGRYPVEADSMDTLRAKHERGERLSLTTLRPGSPPRFSRIVERALATRPAERFASAAGFARALESFAEPARGRRAALLAVASMAAALIALGLAWVALQRPTVVRYVPPERLPGPQVPHAMRLADVVVGTAPGERFGESEAGVGDVNGDGFDDIMVAGTYYSGTSNLQGRAMLYLGNPSGRFDPPAWTAVGRHALNQFGARLAPAGDVNGDGFDDVLVVDELYRESDHQRVGAVSLYLGSAGGLAGEPATRIVGWQPQSEFGSGLAGVGDVNGDGHDDVIVGAPNFTRRYNAEGAVFLYLGTRQGLEPRPAWALYGGERDAGLGFLLSRTGDVNGDGYADVLVGAFAWKGKGSGGGRAQLFPGGPRGLSPSPIWTAVGDQPAGAFGYSTGGVGDVNSDGYGDIVVMQALYSGRGAREGRALLYLGGPHGPGPRPVWTAQGFSSGGALSSGAPGIGDVNGDGVPDILVGSGIYSAGPNRRWVGIVAIYLSPRDPRRPHPAWYRSGDEPGVPISYWCYPAGDFNGDGLSDLVVAQGIWPNDVDRRGRCLLFLGQRLKVGR